MDSTDGREESPDVPMERRQEELDEMRATIRRLNRRAQKAERRLRIVRNVLRSVDERQPPQSRLNYIASQLGYIRPWNTAAVTPDVGSPSRAGPGCFPHPAELYKERNMEEESRTKGVPLEGHPGHRMTLCKPCGVWHLSESFVLEPRDQPTETP